MIMPPLTGYSSPPLEKLMVATAVKTAHHMVADTAQPEWIPPWWKTRASWRRIHSGADVGSRVASQKSTLTTCSCRIRTATIRFAATAVERSGIGMSRWSRMLRYSSTANAARLDRKMTEKKRRYMEKKRCRSHLSPWKPFLDGNKNQTTTTTTKTTTTTSSSSSSTFLTFTLEMAHFSASSS